MNPIRPALALLLTAAALTLGAAPQEEKWIQLFNGKDLDGWTPKFKGEELGINFNDTFRVSDGILHVSYDKYDKWNNNFGHLFYKKTFSHYRLRAEYRFVGEQCPGGPGWAKRNNGLMIHGQSAESMKKDQSFPNSIEVQLLGGLGKGNRPTANLCSPGTFVFMNGKPFKPHCTNSKSKTYNGDQWVTVEVEVHGSETIKHIMEGEVVLQYEKPQLDNGTLLTEGTISIQAESHPTDFRKIEVLELKD